MSVYVCLVVDIWMCGQILRAMYLVAGWRQLRGMCTWPCRSAQRNQASPTDLRAVLTLIAPPPSLVYLSVIILYDLN